MVDGVVGAAFPGEDQLADGHDVVALPDQILQNGGQGLGGVEGGVVEEDDGPRPHPGGHPVGDGGRIVVLPVQTVPDGSGCKVLRDFGLLCPKGRSSACYRGRIGTAERERGLFCWG